MRARAGQADMAVSVFKGPANGLGKAIAHPVVGQPPAVGHLDHEQRARHRGPRDDHDPAPVDCLFPERGSGELRRGGDNAHLHGPQGPRARRGAVLRPRAPSGRGRDVHAHADRDEPADRSRLEQQLEEHHDDRHGRGFARCAPPQSQEAACRTPIHRLGGRGARRGWTRGRGLLGQGRGTPPVVARQAVRWSACDLHVVHSRALPRPPSRRAGQRHPRAYRRGSAPLAADPLELSLGSRGRGASRRVRVNEARLVTARVRFA